MLRKRPSSNGASKVLGFTLIELMVVVAVVAILASIALPSYTESVRKGRRGQAKADLVEAAQIAERFRTINSTYVGVPGFPTVSPKTGTSYYNIAISDQGANTFTLTATPIAGSAQASDRCGVLTINAAGAKTHSAGNDDECQFGTVAAD